MSLPVTTTDIITLGESMWRLAPPGIGERLEAARSLDIQVGGAESNAAIALSRLGQRVAWWSRLPATPLGRHVTTYIRSHGVDVSDVYWSSERLGTYYIEFGSGVRPTEVFYDRADSAASHMTPDDFPWEKLHQTRWLHLTGITPALSQSCLETVRRAITEARSAGIPISFDLNYRAKLWSPAAAAPILDELAGQSSLVIAADRDVKTLFGLEGEDLLLRLHKRWNGANIVLTQGANGATAFDGQSTHHAAAFAVTPTPTTRIGSGDSFDAGLIFALLEDKPLAEALRYGNAVAALKLTMSGDAALVTRAEVEKQLSADAHNVIR